MNLFYSLTLRNKIVAIILTTVMLALSLGFGFSLYQELSATKEYLLKEKILTAKIVGSYTKSDLTFDNKQTALESLSYLKTDTSIINAHLYDNKNKLFVSLYEGLATKEHRLISPSKSSFYEFLENELVVIEPIYLGKQQIGTLYLLSSTEQYLNTIQERIKYFISLVIIIVLLSFLLASKLSSIVTSPILSLVKAVDSFSKNKTYDINVNSKHEDETKQLVTSFNELLAQLKNRENERDAAEKSLVEAEEHTTNILDNLVEGVITISYNGLIQSINNTAENIFGYKEEELIGLSILSLTNEHEIEKYKGHINHFSETGDLGIIENGFETMGVNNTNQSFPVYVTISEIPNRKNNERLFIISCEDISHKKLQEEQIRRTQRMDSLGKLTGGIAHDYNNMLGVIIGYAELIEMEDTSSNTLKSYVSEILHAGERGKSLTAKLLSFTKREATEANITSINTIINQSKDIITKTITSRIELTLNLADNIWDSWLDIGDLEDAIINLSINAMHAMVDGGSLRFETLNLHLSEIEAASLQLPAGDYIQLKIIDTGSGMNESTRTHIFEPFFTTKKDKGTGLGLSQVYGFVKRSNGEIKVYSEVGRGTHFDFYFPRYISTKTTDTEIPQNEIKENKFNGNETVLVVDDEAALRELAKNLLVLYGYNVFTAEDSNEALDILKKNKVDLMLSDIVMPGMDGYQLSTVASMRFPEVKIQLASGFTDNLQHNLSEKNKKLHDLLLQKPYRKDQLLQRIRNLLDN